MIKLKRLIGGIILILVLGIILVPAESTISQKEAQTFAIHGQVLDANTLKPIPDTNITILFQYTEIKENKTSNFSTRAKTDGQGKYAIENISNDFLNRERYRVGMQFNLEGTEYPSIVYSNWDQEFFNNFTNKIKKVTFDFKLLKPTDELILCGRVADIVDGSPLPKIKVNLKLQEFEKGKNPGEKGKYNTLNTIEYETDADGAYKAKVSDEYNPFSRASGKYAQLDIGHFDYISKSNPGIETVNAAQEIKHTINFAQARHDFHIIDSGKEGSLNGLLLDAKGSPVVKVPITVNFGERNK